MMHIKVMLLCILPLQLSKYCSLPPAQGAFLQLKRLFFQHKSRLLEVWSLLWQEEPPPIEHLATYPPSLSVFQNRIQIMCNNIFIVWNWSRNGFFFLYCSASGNVCNMQLVQLQATMCVSHSNAHHNLHPVCIGSLWTLKSFCPRSCMILAGSEPICLWTLSNHLK